jgi:hypothetical protein
MLQREQRTALGQLVGDGLLAHPAFDGSSGRNTRCIAQAC